MHKIPRNHTDFHTICGDNYKLHLFAIIATPIPVAIESNVIVSYARNEPFAVYQFMVYFELNS